MRRERMFMAQMSILQVWFDANVFSRNRKDLRQFLNKLTSGVFPTFSPIGLLSETSISRHNANVVTNMGQVLV